MVMQNRISPTDSKSKVRMTYHLTLVTQSKGE